MTVVKMTASLCPFCGEQAEWQQRDRVSHGWYCRRHADKVAHPQEFGGYLEREQVHAVTVTLEIPTPSTTYGGRALERAYERGFWAGVDAARDATQDVVLPADWQTRVLE